jgi:hypothetical protein
VWIVQKSLSQANVVKISKLNKKIKSIHTWTLKEKQSSQPKIVVIASRQPDAAGKSLRTIKIKLFSKNIILW